jgi:ABC-type nitrate/sulfonate/bicarbonate transport system substrate-binding protein
MKNKEKIIAIVVALIAIAVAFYIYNSKQEHAKIVGSVNLGFSGGESASALYIADELHLFADNGINVTLRPFGTGLASYNAMLKGEVDVSGPTEYVQEKGTVLIKCSRIIERSPLNSSHTLM